jgi:hypothetical protein
MPTVAVRSQVSKLSFKGTSASGSRILACAGTASEEAGCSQATTWTSFSR